MRRMMLAMLITVVVFLYFQLIWTSKKDMVAGVEEALLKADYDLMETFVSFKVPDLEVSKETLGPLVRLYNQDEGFRLQLKAILMGETESPMIKIHRGVKGYRAQIEHMSIKFNATLETFEGVINTYDCETFSQSKALRLLPGLYEIEATGITSNQLTLSSSALLKVDGTMPSCFIPFDSWRFELETLGEGFRSPTFYVNDKRVSPEVTTEGGYVIEQLPMGAKVELICAYINHQFYSASWSADSEERKKVVQSPNYNKMDLKENSKINQYWENVKASGSYKLSNFTYAPEHLNDWHQTVPWIFEVPLDEDLSKNPPYVIFENTEALQLSELSVVNGYAYSENTFNTYGAVKKVRVTLSDGSVYEHHLKQSLERQSIFINETHHVTWCKIEVLDIYDGKQDGLVALTEVFFTRDE